MRKVVITGVSSGIGRATTQVLIQHGIHVFGSVRHSQDGERLTAEFGKQFTPLVFDVTDVQAVQTAAQQVQRELAGEKLFGLFNNAGIDLLGPLLYIPIEAYRKQLEVNLVGPLIVTQAFAPLLGTDRSLSGKPGRIINTSSVGGKIAFPFNGPYHASKFGLEGFSETLRRELLIHGIDVIILGPGSVTTSIWSKAHATIANYEHTEYAPALQRFHDFMRREEHNGYPPEHLGEVVWKILTAPRPSVRYAVVPKPLLNWFLPRFLPKRLVDQFIARQLSIKARS